MSEDYMELFAQAEEHRINGRYTQAQEIYEQILAEHPDFARGWWALAHTLMNQGEFDKALEYFKKACEMEPQNQKFLYDCAMMHTMLGMYDEAKPLFERVISLDPDTRVADEARKQLAYF